MTQKILFFDIDKTLTDNELLGSVPESAVEAIRTARSRGHLAYINTGRVHGNIPPSIFDIGFDGYVCGCGTHVIVGGETRAASRRFSRAQQGNR
jgi:hydroxymethylpyrimidine pyrophosphatase-like HAD family hydrolase